MAAEGLGYQFGEFILEPGEHRLTRKGTEIPLRPKTFEVLVLLVKRHGQLVSKEELLSTVWQDSYVSEGTLRQTIFEIRQALHGQDEQKRLVKTVAKVGYQFTGEVTRIRPEKKSNGAGIWTRFWVMPAALLLLLVLLWQWKIPQQGEPTSHSVAVLPFENLGPDKEDEYFSLGITEEIIAGLAKSDGLRVISRTSVMRYKNTDKPLKEIADELGVTAIVEGSARQDGGRVRITAQLIEAETDEHLWGETYDRNLEDIFSVQSEVAAAICSALHAELNPASEVRFQNQSPERIAAYDLVLRARHCHHSLLRIDQAEDYYRQAVQTDPEYAVAYSGLAETLVFKAIWRLPAGNARDQLLAEADETLNRAHELDPTSAESVACLGYLRGHRLQWTAAEEAFRTALSLNPGHWKAYHDYTILLTRLGRYEEGLDIAQRGHQLNPLDRQSNSDLAWMYLHTGQLDLALVTAERLVELHPEWPFSYETLIEIYGAKGWLERGLSLLDELREESELSEAEFNRLLGCLYVQTGATSEAVRALNQLEILDGEEDATRTTWVLARTYMTVGSLERALDRLEQSGSWILGGPMKGIAHDPLWDPLRTTPRFQALVEKLNLPR